MTDTPRWKPLARAILAACVTGMVAAPASAQGSPDFAALTSFSSGSGPTCGSAVGATFSSRYRGFTARVLPAPVRSLNDVGVGAPAAALDWSSSESRAWRVELGGAVGPANADCAALSAVTRTTLRVSRNFSRGGIALSFGAKSLSSLDPSLDRHGVAFSMWRNVRSTRLGIDLRSHNEGTSYEMLYNSYQKFVIFDSVPNDTFPGRYNPMYKSVTATDSISVKRGRRAFDVLARMRWSSGRLALNLTAGGTAGSSNLFQGPGDNRDNLSIGAKSGRAESLVFRMWGRGDVRISATQYIDVTAGLASLPAQPIIGAPSRRVVTIGVGFNGLPRASSSEPEASSRESAGGGSIETIRLDSTRVKFRIRVANAFRVELSGEPTAWAPVTMRRASDDWWETEVAVMPGSYRMNVRINGSTWSAPPGTVPTKDEFGGEVGLVVLR